MDQEFIKTVQIRDFGCIRDLTLRLTPLHALIGPNDSGKTTVLRALRTACQFGGGTFSPATEVVGQRDADAQRWLPFDPELEQLWPQGSVRLDYGPASYTLSAQDGRVHEEAVAGSEHSEAPRQGWNISGLLHNPPSVHFAPHYLSQVVMPARLVRLDADALKVPSALIPTDQELTLLNERGRGLAAIYDAIVNRDVEGFVAVRHQVRELFPSVKTIGFRNLSSTTKELEFELVGGKRLPARLMSDGFLFFLAFVALRYLSSVRLVLVEEPENGLHPARIREVVQALRQMTSVDPPTQVVLTTHSPLVINELAGDEVSVLTRDVESGTRAVRLEETPNYDQRSQVYESGELWLSYADGMSEEALVNGGPRP